MAAPTLNGRCSWRLYKSALPRLPMGAPFFAVRSPSLDERCEAVVFLRTEANGMSDNPLIFANESEALSGGNFHAEPVAFAAA